MIRILVLLLLATRVFAFEWTSLWIQPGIARDFAMGNATGAMFGTTSQGSSNPAGFLAFPKGTRAGITGAIQASGLASVTDYFDQSKNRRSTISQASDVASLFVRSVSAKYRWATATAILAEPVMRRDETTRFDDRPENHALAEYQTGVILNLLLHPRVRIGGRVDFYSRDFEGDGEGFSYGVVLKPRGVQVGLHYQRFPVTGARWLHPLDRRIDQGTTASIAIQKPEYTLAFLLSNLSKSDMLGFLEPRVGAEWRPWRALAVRAGGSLFTRSRGAAATAGIGLLDANWFRKRENRLAVPEDILSGAFGILYDAGRPVQGFTTVTLAWRL
jgi:hypothetical protein